MKPFAILALTLFLTAACSSHSNDDTITAVEIMINNSDFDAAQRACDKLVADSASNQLSASQWGQLAITYMHLAENINEDDNTALATQCYRKAFATDCDSATAFFDNIGIEEAAFAHTLLMLSSSIDTPADLLDFEADTIPSDIN